MRARARARRPGGGGEGEDHGCLEGRPVVAGLEPRGRRRGYQGKAQRGGGHLRAHCLQVLRPGRRRRGRRRRRGGRGRGPRRAVSSAPLSFATPCTAESALARRFVGSEGAAWHSGVVREIRPPSVVSLFPSPPKPCLTMLLLRPLAERHTSWVGPCAATQ